jgi:hypothetical protein
MLKIFSNPLTKFEKFLRIGKWNYSLWELTNFGSIPDTKAVSKGLLENKDKVE